MRQTPYCAPRCRARRHAVGGKATTADPPRATRRDDEPAVLAAVGGWRERDVRPHVHALEKDDIYPAEMVEQMKALGLFGATIGQAYGGLRLLGHHTAPLG